MLGSIRAFAAARGEIEHGIGSHKEQADERRERHGDVRLHVERGIDSLRRCGEEGGALVPDQPAERAGRVDGRILREIADAERIADGAADEREEPERGRSGVGLVQFDIGVVVRKRSQHRKQGRGHDKGKYEKRDRRSCSHSRMRRKEPVRAFRIPRCWRA